jgi:hypothetical protein
MKHTGYLLCILALVFMLWGFPVMYPLKLLVVFFHESSHALATVLTGGRVEEMVVNSKAGGHVLSQGGNRFVSLNAGYLGSLIWGVVIYTFAASTRMDRPVMAFLGVVIALITLFYVRNLFAILFGLTTATAMILCARYLNEKINDFILRIVGLTSMIYVLLDIFDDTISRSHLRSDARMLAEEFGGGTILWGCLWIMISAVIVASCLRWNLETGSEAKRADTTRD